MIELRGLHKSFGQNHVLAGVDLSIERGKSMVIIGGSGTGKSVLLKSILGLITPDQGQIFVDGQDVTRQIATHFWPDLACYFRGRAI